MKAVTGGVLVAKLKKELKEDIENKRKKLLNKLLEIGVDASDLDFKGSTIYIEETITIYLDENDNIIVSEDFAPTKKSIIVKSVEDLEEALKYFFTRHNIFFRGILGYPEDD